MALANLDTSPRLDALLTVTRLVHADVPRAELVSAVAEAIATSLEFATVAINLRHPGSDDFAVAAVHGSDGVRAALDGTTSRWPDWEPLLDERFAVAGAYLVPAGSVDWDRLGSPSYIPPAAETTPTSAAWDPEDALFVPLADSAGELIGIVSVDEPRSGCRPTDEDLRLLTAFCAHLGAALELADLGAAHIARSDALERLARTSVAALGSLDLDASLTASCEAVAEGLGYEHVEIALVEDQRLLTRCSVGTDRRLDDLPLGELADVLAASPVVDRCHRLAVSLDKPMECLLTKLTGSDGRLVGVLRAAAPRPNALDGVERRRLLRTFANQVEATVSSAALRAVRDSEARKSAMLAASLDAILTMDARGRIVEFNPAAEVTFGHRREDAIGRDLGELIIPEELREAHRAGLRRYIATEVGGPVVGNRLEVRALRADGTTFPAELAVVRIALEGPPLLTAYLRDISARVEAREALERERDQARHTALHDPVTGLPNRIAALEHVAERMPALAAAGGGLLALGVELGGFELITQSLGFAHGDDLLRAAGGRLRRRGGAWGWFVAQTGRCEFLVLVACPDPSPRVVDAIASDVEATVRRPFEIDGLELEVDAVVGHALLADADAQPADLLRRVDVARHHARADGAIVAYDAGRDSSRRTLTMLAALRGAVERCELELHYQPIHRVGGDGALLGLEALLRWRRDGTLVPPGDFIALAESSGLIAPIGEWVIDEACRQAGTWRRAGLQLPVVGVNVSPRQLSGDVAGVVAAALGRHGVPAERLCVEVTESAIELGAGSMLALLHELGSLGVRCAIDDFGADYSSLNRIASLPVRMIKLDRGFLTNVPEDPRARRLLAGVIGVARGLGVATVVEGVERRSQLELLPGFGADLVQGFLLARPEPPEVVVARLAPAASIA